MPAAQPKSQNVGGQNPEFLLREFEGMNVRDARECIGDQEFAWCENAIPIGSGNLAVVNGPSAALVSITGETGPPSYSLSYSTINTFVFAVWKNSGNGWIVNLVTNAATKIITGLTSGQTSATQYSNQGLLIVDPTGYWDYGVTAANTLTPQNNSVTGFTLTSATAEPGGTELKQIVTTASGTGGAFQTQYEVSSVSIKTAGTGYIVGDTLTMTDGNPSTPATVVVTTIGAGGTITGIELTAGGTYPGPTSATLVATGPVGATFASGTAGTGAVLNVQIIAVSCTVVTPGTGYGNTDTVQDELSGGTVVDTFTVMSSGIIGATSIATYAGRVWLGIGRVVFFTDIDSYNSFGGAGGSFTINDAYFQLTITALFAANNYLYIFSFTSVDILSNVNIVSGVTSFSRINVTSSIGTQAPTSIFAYYRSIVFFHTSGFYILSGATPERISEKIQGIVRQIAIATAPANSIYGGQLLIMGELCAAFAFQFVDIFTPIGGTRSLMALFFRNRWWVASLNAMTFTGLVARGNMLGYVWVGTSLYQAFDAAAALTTWLVQTKLWDGGAPLHEKQSLNAALCGLWAGSSASGVSFTIDTETGSNTPSSFTLTGSPTAYQLARLVANQGGSQYLGMTVTGGANLTRLDMLGLRGKQMRDILQ